MLRLPKILGFWAQALHRSWPLVMLKRSSGSMIFRLSFFGISKFFIPKILNFILTHEFCVSSLIWFLFYFFLTNLVCLLWKHVLDWFILSKFCVTLMSLMSPICFMFLRFSLPWIKSHLDFLFFLIRVSLQNSCSYVIIIFCKYWRLFF
jgi:TM2 domain-containing membrane protein YozV